MNICPVCQADRIQAVVRIDNVPVHCNLLWPTHAEAVAAARGDIWLMFCPECGHTFNRAFNPQKMEYTQAYENSLHFSPVFQRYAESLAARLVKQYSLRQKRIIEIGSGQGDFLRMLCDLGQNQGFGFDPSYHAERAPAGDPRITIIADYYTEKYAGMGAEFICSRHVLEHIYAPQDFIAQLRRSIGARQSVVFFEVPNALYTLQDLGIWDLIYEHCSYFSRYSLARIFTQNGFRVLNLEETFGKQFLTIELLPIPGSEPADPPAPPPETLVDAAARFADHYHHKVTEWRRRLEGFRAQERKVVLWGAGSKGVSFLNTLPDSSAIQYVIDINPRKQGQFVAGTGQEILSPDCIRDYAPDVVILMNPNYELEITGLLQDCGVSADVLVA